MSRESHLELKVGGFVLLAVLGLSFFIASVSDFSFMEKGRALQVVFNFANGLKEAAPVRIAGVDAGTVKRLQIFVDEADGKKTKVKVLMFIQDGPHIPIDSTVTINQLGLLGEKYVEITPGQSTEFLKEDGVIRGVDPLSMERVTERVGRLTDRLDMTVERINTGLLSERNLQSVEGVLAELREILGQVKHGQGTVGKFLSDDAIYRNLEELTADLKVNPWKLLYRPKSR